MNRTRLLAAVVLLIFLFASCAPKVAPVPTSTPSPAPAPTATSIPHGSEIRFALIGNVTPVNVWALFDAKGYSYNNYAVMSGYWPRLYQLSIPDRNFEPMAASGMPSSFQQEGSFYTATVPLRSDLKWTDETPFTADDVAFTVNTAVPFQLGFDWHDFYNPDFIDHAEAVDAHTVKFYFKKQPNVGVWQYSALQGPIVQKAYWSSKVSDSAALLPPNDLAPQIASLTAQVAETQSKIDELNATLAVLSMTSSGYLQTVADIKGLQANLNQTNTALAKAQSQYDSAMDAARQSLYALDNTDEPTLSDWMPAGQEKGAWINKVNPAHPFNVPHFDSVAYQFFSSEDDALIAFLNRNTDLILEPNGLSQNAVGKISNNSTVFFVKSSPTSNFGFVIINQGNSNIANPILHQALACMVDQQNLPDLEAQVMLPDSFTVSDGIFSNHTNSIFPCNGLSSSHIALAVKLLSSAGYSWSQAPSGIIAGQGLKLPNGRDFPSITMLVLKSDPLRVLAAVDFQQWMRLLGIPLTAQQVSENEINYTIFSSHQFDMALLGYTVSEYPGYLCDWFQDGNPFGYQSVSLQSACEALNSTSDLSTAQKDVYEIQSILARDLPFIPFYSSITYDAYRNIKYPFDSILGGLSGIYGAPSLAIPAP